MQNYEVAKGEQVEATLSGRGLMIGHTSVLSALIAQGRLQPLSDQRVAAGNQFYLLTKASSPLSDIAETFIDWIVEQATPDGAAG